MGSKILGSEVIAVEDMIVVPIDLDVSANWQVSWSDEFISVIDVLVLGSLQEWSFNNTRVLLSWLENGNGIVGQIERNDESSVNILWDSCVESGSVSEHLLIVVNVLEEVNLWLLGDQVVDVTKGVKFVTKAVVGWDLDLNWASWSWESNVTEWEFLA